LLYAVVLEKAQEHFSYAHTSERGDMLCKLAGGIAILSLDRTQNPQVPELFDQGYESDLSLKLPATHISPPGLGKSPLIYWCPMAHIFLDSWCQWSTEEILQTVVETPTYLAIANKLFSEEERAAS
jgi:hypothetical protein